MKWKLLYAFGFAFSTLSLPLYAFSAYPYTNTTALFEVSSYVPKLPKLAMFPAELGISDYVTSGLSTTEAFLGKT